MRMLPRKASSHSDAALPGQITASSTWPLHNRLVEVDELVWVVVVAVMVVVVPVVVVAVVVVVVDVVSSHVLHRTGHFSWTTRPFSSSMSQNCVSLTPDCRTQ